MEIGWLLAAELLALGAVATALVVRRTRFGLALAAARACGAATPLGEVATDRFAAAMAAGAAKGGETFPAKMTLEVPGLSIRETFDGEIKLG